MIILIILILSCLIIFCRGCSDRKYLEDDFELIFTVDKENVKIAEEVKITATFKNNSGQGLFIKLGRPFYKEIEHMIDIRWYKPDEEHHFATISPGGRSKICWLRKDEVITVEVIFKPKEVVVYDCVALVSFYTGKDFENKIIF